MVAQQIEIKARDDFQRRVDRLAVSQDQLLRSIDAFEGHNRTMLKFVDSVLPDLPDFVRDYFTHWRGEGSDHVRSLSQSLGEFVSNVGAISDATVDWQDAIAALHKKAEEAIDSAQRLYASEVSRLEVEKQKYTNDYNKQTSEFIEKRKELEARAEQLAKAESYYISGVYDWLNHGGISEKHYKNLKGARSPELRYTLLTTATYVDKKKEARNKYPRLSALYDAYENLREVVTDNTAMIVEDKKKRWLIIMVAIGIFFLIR